MDKANSVRSMFGRIAPRYDLLNHLLSFNLDKGWRLAAVAAVDSRPGDRVVDLCAGTLDLAIQHARRGARVVALDFCRGMLVHGRRKSNQLDLEIPLVEGDAMRTPFADGSFDVATVAFGVRNLADPVAGLAELVRLLAPGGRLAILEFVRPRHPLVRALYYPYFRHVLPRLGAIISGDGAAYRYLPESVLAFLEPDQLIAHLSGAGLEQVRYRSLAGGTVTLVSGHKPGTTQAAEPA